MEKPTKEEVRGILFDYVLAVTRHSDLTNEEAFEKAYSDLCADEEDGVEWVPVPEGRCVNQDVDIYVANTSQVFKYHGRDRIPQWATHWSPAPPRKMPKPPKQEAQP